MDESKASATPEEKPESIRDWYDRTTRKARRALAWATVMSFLAMGTMWVVSDLATLQRLQTFNGALTVPLIGGLWIFSFIFMFLVPSREASFRAQETLEDGVATLHKLVGDEILPVVQVWQRIGLQVEKEYPEIRKKIESSISDLKKTSERVEKALEDNTAFVNDAKPVLAALKRIEERIEEDLLDDMKLMAEAVKRMGGVPSLAAKVPAKQEIGMPETTAPTQAQVPVPTEPNLSAALSRLQSRRKKEAASQAQ